jgi:hypothetical protein
MLPFKLGADIARIPTSTLRRFVDLGYIVPICRGLPIKGHSDWFSYAQVYGLICVQAMREFLGLHPNNVKRMLDEFLASETEEMIAADADRQYHFLGPGEPQPQLVQPQSCGDHSHEEIGEMARKLFPPEMMDAISGRRRALIDHYRRHVLNKQQKIKDRASKPATTNRAAQTAKPAPAASKPTRAAAKCAATPPPSVGEPSKGSFQEKRGYC